MENFRKGEVMLKLIVSGHGEYAKGMYQALTMIAGQQDHVVAVLFEDGMDLMVYQEKLAAELNDDKDGYIFLTDLKGGTPFNISMMVSQTADKVRVISGTNLPMLIEGALLSTIESDVDTLVEQLIKTGKDGIDSIQLSDIESEDDGDEGGI